MINSKILVSVIIVLLIGIAAAGYQITSNPAGISSLFGSQAPATTDQGQTGTGTSGQGSSGQSQIGSGGNSASSSGQSSSGQSSGQSGTGGGNVKISSTEAQALAQKYISQTGFKAGTPELNGGIYTVPVVSTSNGTQVGEIYIDAQTGKNKGGAGGAPNG
jgi:Peptidase propeptide and YPEB domain